MGVFCVDAEIAIKTMEAERRRLARDIHDGPAQLLTNLTMRLEVVKEMLKHSPHTVLPEIGRIQEMMRVSVGELRRMIYDLRPVEMAETGLAGALLAYAERCQFLLRIPITIHVEGSTEDLPEVLAIALFRIVQESIASSLRQFHPQRIDVFLSANDKDVRVVVRDDGVNGTEAGFEGMRERAQLFGGDLQVCTDAAKGTEVTCSIHLGGD